MRRAKLSDQQRDEVPGAPHGRSQAAAHGALEDHACAGGLA
jgi:hypothetical protein